MPDSRRHRGPHPEDALLFADAELPQLRTATEEFCYLMDRDYPPVSSLKLVGDRWQLRERQRTAINRSVCSALAAAARRRRERAPREEEHLKIDGFNLLTTIEAALSGGIVLIGREGCRRDMASMHGSYRRVEETAPAIELIGQTITSLPSPPSRVTWYLDQPVSNSGRLAAALREQAASRQWPWEVEVTPDPDRDLKQCTDDCVVSADREIIDACGPWWNLARDVLKRANDVWTVDLHDTLH